MGNIWKTCLIMICVLSSLCHQLCFAQSTVTDIVSTQGTSESGVSVGATTSNDASTDAAVTDASNTVSLGVTSHVPTEEDDTQTDNTQADNTQADNTQADNTGTQAEGGSTETMTDGGGQDPVSTEAAEAHSTAAAGGDPKHNTTKPTSGVTVSIVTFYGHWLGLVIFTILMGRYISY